MWDEESSAETVTIHPWAGVTQPQMWRGSNPAPGNAPPPQRGWDAGQQPQPGGWPPQMAWAPPGGAPPAGAGWHMPQPQWGGGSPAFADKNKRPGGSMQPSTSGAPRFDGPVGVPSGGWAGGALKVDQQTPWETSGGGRWGQPAAVGMPRVVSNGLWPPNGALMNGIPMGGAPGEWSSGASIAAMSAAAAAAAMHRSGALPPPQVAGSKMPPYDLTGTGHWKTSAPPPPPPPPAATAAAMMAIMPPGAGAPAILPPAVTTNWCQPGGIAGAPPPAPDPSRLPFDASGAPPGPNQWTEMNNDMMWHDPNPKEKKVQRDTGTAVWGDPCVQRSEIRRWKDADVEHDYPAPPSGTDWASMPLNVVPAVIPPHSLAGGYDPNNGAGGEPSTDSSPPGGAPPPAAGWGEPAGGGTGGDTGTGVWVANAAVGFVDGPSAGGWSAADVAAAGGKQLSPEELANLGKKLQQYQQQQRSNGRQQIPSQQQQSDGPPAPNVAAIIATMKKHQAAFRQPPGTGATAAAVAAAGKPDAWQWAACTLDALRKVREQELVKSMRAGADQNEQSRLYEEIQRIKTDIFDLTAVMFNNNGENSNNNNNNSTNDNSSNVTGNNNEGNNNGATLSQQQQQQQQQQLDNGQSRLQQWRKTAGGGGSGNASPGANGGPAADATVSLLAATQSLSINASVEGTERTADWKSGMLDWSAPSTVGSGDSFVDVTARLSQGNNSMNGFEAVTDDVTAVGGGAKSALLDDGPPEFVPGKKWEWRDPNKVAEDPNATPGTCKPNPLISRNFAAGSGGFLDHKGWPNGGRVATSIKLSGADLNAGGCAPANYYWVLIQMVDMSKQQVQAICGRVGQLLLFMVVGHKVACVKFAESNPAGILQRLKAEFMILQYLKVVSDEEFEKMIRRSYDNDVPITSRWSADELGGAGGSAPTVRTPGAPPASGAASF